ncbi:MAG: iron-sulfur cluster assembly protein, partial [Planctomycetota bacterium]
MPLTPADLTDALRTVLDPDIRKDLVTLGMVKETRVEGDRAFVTVELTTPACPMKDKIRGDIEAAIAAKAAEKGVPSKGVEVTFTADVRRANERTRDGTNPLPGVRQVIAVGAGKGGVGKSTVAL